ncbi:protein MIGRI [Chitinimonas sp. PSY-7]|uniref:protein MIGRI n=1 Tax=Chitinimonas sp. PSY-7 TaxID=3459088 RepID=UPI00403FCEA1
MLAKFIRLALFALAALLIWNAILKPDTRRRFRSYIETLAFALLASSVLMMGWHWWRHGS